MKKYSILGGIHPNERLECAVDVIGDGSSANLLVAETLSLVLRVSTSLPFLQGLRCFLRIGHVLLIRAICVYLGLTDDETQSKILEELYRFQISNSNFIGVA